MNISKIIGAILIVVSLGVGYIGINKVSDSTKHVSLLGVSVKGSNKSAQQEGYMYLGAALILFVGGIYSIQAKR